MNELRDDTSSFSFLCCAFASSLCFFSSARLADSMISFLDSSFVRIRPAARDVLMRWLLGMS